MKNVAFTICAKNYLAQAITLKKSFEQHNPESDFFIYLADEIGDGIVISFKDGAFMREVAKSDVTVIKFLRDDEFSCRCFSIHPIE